MISEADFNAMQIEAEKSNCLYGLLLFNRVKTPG